MVFFDSPAIKKGVPYETHLACEVQSLKFSSLLLRGGGGCDFEVDIVDT